MKQTLVTTCHQRFKFEIHTQFMRLGVYPYENVALLKLGFDILMICAIIPTFIFGCQALKWSLQAMPSLVRVSTQTRFWDSQTYPTISNIILLQLVWNKRHRRAKKAFQIDAMLVFPDTMTKGGGQHVFSFLIVPSYLNYNSKHKGHPIKVKEITEILS